MLTLNIIHAAEVVELIPADPDGETVILQPGDVVEYRGHVPLGMVRVRLPDGRTGIIHPHATKELR